jgi:hypothetical protein
LIPIERGQGNKEADRPPAKLIQLADEGKYAEWRFPITAKTIGYRIELTDARGFTSPAPARRGVRVWPDEPPTVEFRRESTRNPDPTDFYAQGSPDLYVWEIPVAWQPTGAPGEGDSGPIQVIYAAKSELGIGRVNLAYRVIPKGEQAENLHPRDDPAERVFKRLPLTPYTADLAKVGKWVPDLGLFEWSFVRQLGPPRTYLSTGAVCGFRSSCTSSHRPTQRRVRVIWKRVGRYNFQTNGLKKPISEGQLAKLEVGDTVELYVEVFDKYSEYLEGKKLPGRPAGYTREARSKTIVSEEEAGKLYEAHKRLQDKLRSITPTTSGGSFSRSPLEPGQCPGLRTNAPSGAKTERPTAAKIRVLNRTAPAVPSPGRKPWACLNRPRGKPAAGSSFFAQQGVTIFSFLLQSPPDDSILNRILTGSTPRDPPPQGGHDARR